MPINKTNFVVAALITCSVAALAGSISSTIAWYQYSTRVSAVYLGTSAGSKGNLFLLTANEINRLDDNFLSRPGRIRYHYKFPK